MVADRLGAAADAGADPDAWAAAYIAALGEGCDRDEAMDLADEVAGAQESADGRASAWRKHHRRAIEHAAAHLRDADDPLAALRGLAKQFGARALREVARTLGVKGALRSKGAAARGILKKLNYQRLRRYDTTDREGHAHRGKGPGGGQFVAKGGASSGRDDEPRFAKPAAKRGTMTGAQRIGKGKEARIVMADGSPAPAHIKPSMVPPDWSDVQISTDPDSDVLVQARDNKGRAKTVYRDDYHMRTAAVKFARVEEAMREMPGMLAQMQRDRDDPAKREQAECAWLMAEQATRPGSESDTGAKVKAYGATTLRAEHVETDEDGTVRLHFIGKEGVEHNHVIHNPELAAMLVARKQSADRRGGKLFATDETKVRDYVAQLDGGGFLSKDLRTVRANMIAIREIHATAPPATEKQYKAAVKAVAERVSHVLGNRPAQALESYINPAVFSSWRAGLKPEQPKPKGKPGKRKAAA